MINWLSEHYLEVFGAITGIVYVILEVRQTIWLWPLGIVTSAIYVYIFFVGKLYADMALQGYYVVISVLGWWWWKQGSGRRAQDAGLTARSMEQGAESRRELAVTRLKQKTGIILLIAFILLFAVMWVILSRFTDSPVPLWDAFLTSLSVIATWMLARKIYEHWFLWIVVNIVSTVLFLTRGLYPTVILYMVYAAMSFAGLAAWKKTIKKDYNEN